MNCPFFSFSFKVAKSAGSGFTLQRITGDEGQAALQLKRASVEEAQAWEAAQAASKEDAIHQEAGKQPLSAA